MITVTGSGFRNNSMPQRLSLNEGATVRDFATAAGIDSPDQAVYRVDGSEATLDTELYSGAIVSYSMRNIKGA